ncbi:MAG: hypothetical protein A2391_00885 [Candidatus Brennerbacteria bacterium RIFOXYB1_FULL_41_13]|uniref:G-protein coupled receptors family 1 profile domain-containing protein n=1 Tax=Candidatus Brennerbacteria bacterium RIFOXYD1_FULL_41_16 TaxID=1797529 RepID=A0A1G1XKI8_9BACT|nr:MAG: hypothetical protein A2391_00885 [Candidatus Brennerbacteria bacterium RIFOXYB1_FULL_41_13]OGY40549.1 MAG: hypothetical protein A2570_02315 [Candidatus Brennerbacteria bacterium RIFOXYD1_FULL_41_16]
MNIPEIFKYGTIISAPLFLGVSLLLIKRLPDFSFSKHTISKSVLFIDNRFLKTIFRLNFVIKALLDFGFVLYLANKLEITNNFIVLPLFLTPVFFISLSYFIEGKYNFWHRTLAYCSGASWIVGQVLLAFFTKNIIFIIFTIIISAAVSALTLLSILKRKVNIVVQLAYSILLYLWLLVFVFKFL